MNPIPDTTNYMIAGYAVIFIVMAVYLTSFFIRSHNLKQDFETLQELEKKQS